MKKISGSFERPNVRWVLLLDESYNVYKWYVNFKIWVLKIFTKFGARYDNFGYYFFISMWERTQPPHCFFIGKFQFTFTINCPKLLKFTNKPTTSTVQKRTWWVDHWLISIFSAIIVKVTVTPRIKPHKEKPTHSSTTDYEESRPQWQPHNLLCESHKNKPKIFTCRLRAQNRTQSV